jgi:hypothetical protein
VLAKAHRVTLLEIPAVPHLTPIEELPILISNLLRAAGRKVPRQLLTAKVDFRALYSQDQLRDVKDIVRQRKGRLVSLEYAGALGKLDVICRKGHPFKTTPTSLKSGFWCRRCGKENQTAALKRKAIETLRRVAANRGGSLESKTHPSIHHPLSWRCKSGHRFTASSHAIKTGKWCDRCKAESRVDAIRALVRARGGRLTSKAIKGSKSPIVIRCGDNHRFSTTISRLRKGQWCPACHFESLKSRYKYSIEDLVSAARKRNGRCSSQSFTGVSQKYEFECSAGHSFKRIGYEVLKGGWCPQCRGRGRSLAFFRELAESRGGNCLSQRYVNNVTKMMWQCSNGHTWLTIPKVILRGRWCPKCARASKEPTVLGSGSV